MQFRKELHNCLLVGLLGLSAIATSASAQETIKIGVIQPLTGSVAYNGTTDVNGSKLAADEINAKGGVLGKKIELIIEDGQCKPANSVNAAEKLIQRDKVVAVSGAFCSSATLAVMPVAQNYKIPLVTGVSSSASLTEKGNTWFFRATETDALLAKSFAKILFNELKLRKVAYIGVNDDFGRGGVAEFEKQLYLVRRRIEKKVIAAQIHDFYVCSLSARSIIYKGLFLAESLADFYPDLTNKLFESRVAIFHQRYSTNTFPQWWLAQPFRCLAHNGEINTIRGNKNWMKSHEIKMASLAFGEHSEDIKPVIPAGASDTAALDAVLKRSAAPAATPRPRS